MCGECNVVNVCVVSVRGEWVCGWGVCMCVCVVSECVWRVCDCVASV